MSQIAFFPRPECPRLLPLDSIDASTPAGLRDKALIGLMTYSFARVVRSSRHEGRGSLHAELPPVGEAA